MQIPGLGHVTWNTGLDWYQSEPVPVPVLDGTPCRFIVDGYDDDPAPEDFHAAIRAFLTLDRSALTAATAPIFAYYRDVTDAIVDAGDLDWYVEIQEPDEVFDHIGFGDEPIVRRDPYGDRRVYVSLECECDWEVEHGLQLVFRDGRTITKIGPCNGHLTNAAAYADDTLVDVVYHQPW
ncbi:DUF6985 domain-containing protein [Spirillospora sp. CA-253888]